MFDFVFDDFEYSFEEPIFSRRATRIQKIIYDWCTDDNGKNILYKKNGDERYPQFKLYKMIARTVHNCVPREQFTKPIFQQFILKKGSNKQLKKGAKKGETKDLSKIMDVDMMESLC
jgi:hypothetical protein